MIHVGDITKLNGAELPVVDIITGGSPCQDLSIAGTREGLDGERSGLFLEYVRLVREMKEATDGQYPNFIVFENVPGLLSSNKGQDFITVMDMMDEIGFIPDPNIHDAQYYGVPQRRKRIGIVWANVDYLMKQKTILSDSIMLQCLAELLLIDFAVRLKALGVEPIKSEYRPKWLSEDGRKRRIKLFSLHPETKELKMWQERLDEIQATCQKEQEDSVSDLGEIQMELWQWIDMDTNTDSKKGNEDTSIGMLLKKVLEENSQPVSEYTTSTSTNETTISRISSCFEMLLNTLDVTNRYIRYVGETSEDVASYFGWVPSILILMKEYINARQTNGKSFVAMVGHDILRTWDIQLSESEESLVGYIRKMSRREIQSFRKGLRWDSAESGEEGEGIAEGTEGGSDIAISFQERAGKPGGGKGILIQEDRVGALSTLSNQMVFDNISVGSTVRRLTPMECERLQKYPDGWTDIGEWEDSSGKKHKTTDSNRYKALGNSIAIPFWFCLMRRIAAQYERPATLGSLFDGIGGFPYVHEMCNGSGTAIWASEIDSFCIAVTEKHFGEEDFSKYMNPPVEGE